MQIRPEARAGAETPAPMGRLNVGRSSSDRWKVLARAGATGVGLATPAAVLILLDSDGTGMAGVLGVLGILALPAVAVAWQVVAGLWARREGGGLLRKLAGVTLCYWAGASVVLWAAWVLWIGTTGWLTLDSALFGLVAMSGAWLWGALTGLVVALVVMASTISRAGRQRVAPTSGSWASARTP